MRWLAVLGLYALGLIEFILRLAALLLLALSVLGLCVLLDGPDALAILDVKGWRLANRLVETA